MTKWFSDICYAARNILRNRLLSIFTIVVATVSAVFLNVVLQLADTVYGDNPPFTNADRSVSIYTSDFKKKDGRYVKGIKAKSIRGFTKKVRNLENSSVSNTESVMVLAEANVIPTYASFVSGQYWEINDFSFIEGRPFTEDEAFDAAKVAVVTESFARHSFGKGPAAGREIEVQGIKYEIIGVVEDYSSFSVSNKHPEVWLTCSNTKFLPSGDPYYVLDLMFTEDVTEEELKQDLLAALKDFYRVRKVDLDLETEDILTVKEARIAMFGDIGGLFIGIGVIIVLLLLIPVANIVSLNESGIQGRMPELAVRRALGATKGDIVRLLMTENLLLVMAGTVIGIALTGPAVGLAESLFFRAGGIEATILADNVSAICIVAVFIYAIVFSALSTGIPAWLSVRKCTATLMKGGDYVQEHD